MKSHHGMRLHHQLGHGPSSLISDHRASQFRHGNWQEAEATQFPSGSSNSRCKHFAPAGIRCSFHVETGRETGIVRTSPGNRVTTSHRLTPRHSAASPQFLRGNCTKTTAGKQPGTRQAGTSSSASDAVSTWKPGRSWNDQRLTCQWGDHHSPADAQALSRFTSVSTWKLHQDHHWQATRHEAGTSASASDAVSTWKLTPEVLHPGELFIPVSSTPTSTHFSFHEETHFEKQRKPLYLL